MISRQHSNFYFVEESKVVREEIIVRMCIKKSRECSVIRKISEELLENIFAYVKEKEHYRISDEGSRNGIFFKELPSWNGKQWLHKPIKLAEAITYEFDG